MTASQRKAKLERERVLAEYYQEHKEGDEWEDTEVDIDRATTRGASYSIRLSADELDILRSVADREGKRISQVLRDGLRKYLSSQRAVGYSIATDPFRSRFLYFTPVASGGMTVATKARRLTLHDGEAGPGTESI